MALRRNNGFKTRPARHSLALGGWLALSLAVCLQAALAQDAGTEQPADSTAREQATPDLPATEPAPGAPDDAAAEPAPAANASASFGRMIRIPLPIVGELDNRVRAMVRQALSSRPPGEGRPVLVFELWPEGTEFGQGCDFYRAQALADYGDAGGYDAEVTFDACCTEALGLPAASTGSAPWAPTR